MYIEPSSPERVLQRKNNEDIIKEVQIKTTMSYHLAAVGMMTHAEDVQKLEPFYTVGGNVKWYSPREKIMEIPPKIKNETVI